MWPRLSKITALVSILGTFVAVVYQLQQLRKDCPAHVSLPDCIRVVLFPSSAKTEYQHEVKNTDSDEVLERFIGKYKEGPEVELAKKRLQVVRAWTPIKNTNNPHTLSAFLLNYHDSVFEKLAKDALEKLDDQAWQLAVSVSTREAITTYKDTWSAFDGRHLQDAQTKLNELDDDDTAWKVASREDTPEAYRRYLNHPWTRHAVQAQERLDEFLEAAKRTYWDLDESDSEIKCTATSTMYSITEGAAVKFYYELPSECMKQLPVKKDTLKFEGTKNGKWYRGKAYVFTKYCGGKRIAYDVRGSENDDHTLITLEGPAPVIEKETCRIHHLTWDSMNSTLEFRAKIAAERATAKIKPSDKPDQIRR